MGQDTSTAPLSHKNQNTAAIPPAVIPVHTGIHSSTHARCRVWKRTRHNQQLHRAKPGNEAAIPSNNTRCTMVPRVREDDERRDRKRLTNRSYKEDVGITKD